MRDIWRDIRWTCLECGHVNSPEKIICKNCNKRRWAQFRFNLRDAANLAERIKEEHLYGVEN